MRDRHLAGYEVGPAQPPPVRPSAPHGDPHAGGQPDWFDPARQPTGHNGGVGPAAYPKLHVSEPSVIEHGVFGHGHRPEPPGGEPDAADAFSRHEDRSGRNARLQEPAAAVPTYGRQPGWFEPSEQQPPPSPTAEPDYVEEALRTVPNLHVVQQVASTDRHLRQNGPRGRHRHTASESARRWRMLPLVLTAMFLAQFDFFAVNIAAPGLQKDLHASDAALELVVAGYAFTFASGMVTGGRLGDLYGYRRLFLVGTASFLLASLLCGIAASPGQLVAARLLQGLTGAAMVPQVLALITATFPVDERPRALSWFGITGGFSSVAGQLFGGLLLDANLFGLGWRNIFLVNVPVGIVLLVLAARMLPPAQGEHRPRLDPVGAVGLASALALALVPLALGREQGWPVWTWLCLVASVPALMATLRWERRLALRGGEPLLDLALFRSRAFSGGLAVNAAFLAFWGSFMFVLGLLLQSGLGLTASQAGLTFLPLGILFTVSSLLGRKLLARYGRWVLPGATAVSATGLTLLVAELYLLGPAITPALMLFPLAVVGLGNGVIMPLVIGQILAGVPTRQAGAASGVLTTTQQFASAAGVAVLGAVFFTGLGPNPARVDFASASLLVLLLDVVLVVCSGLLMLRMSAQPPSARASVLPSPREQERDTALLR